jgi:ADP-ribosylglycohydrolase
MAASLTINVVGAPHRHLQKTSSVPALEKYQGAMIFSAVGDALGWPTEFIRLSGKRRPPFKLPVTSYVSWRKRVGGKWWGYTDEIKPGEYSDDTQLTLAVARSVSDTGHFEPRLFAYQELPLWLQYERGGGRSVKTAARALVRRNADWLHNFYRQGSIDYRSAGANGAAMRNLPIALVHADDEAALVRDSFFNSVITHGHPRAILGAILFALAVRHILVAQPNGARSTLLGYLEDTIPTAGRFVNGDVRVNAWIENWDRGTADTVTFKRLFQFTKLEAQRYLAAIPQYLDRDPEDYYRAIGAFSPETRGSGLASVCAALYLYIRSGETPDKAMYTAVNLIGSDTDTIAVFLGSLLGAEHGIGSVPTHLAEGVQDKGYLLKTAHRLHSIARTKVAEVLYHEDGLHREEAYLRLLAWEMSFNEMFWDDLSEGDEVTHPTMGSGKVTSKDEQIVPRREEYLAKLIRLTFDSGQTCVFHSRINKESLRVAESLEEDLRRALDAGRRPTAMKTYRVSPIKGGGWRIEDISAEETLSTHQTKAQAVEKAMSIAEAQDVSKLEILKQDGTLERVRTCGQQPRSLFDD